LFENAGGWSVNILHVGVIVAWVSQSSRSDDVVGKNA
jgi:hypothetical protein